MLVQIQFGCICSEWTVERLLKSVLYYRGSDYYSNNNHNNNLHVEATASPSQLSMRSLDLM